MSERLKALYVCFDAIPSPKGASTHVTYFVKALAQVYDVTLMSVSNSAAERDFSPYYGARHVAVPLSEPNFLDRALEFRERVWDELEDHRYDLVHFRTMWVALPIAEEKKRQGFKVVCEVNGVDSIELKYHYPALRAHPWLIEKLRAQERLAFETADVIITPSRVTKRYIAHQGVGEEKVVVIPNGVDVDLFALTPGPSPTLRERGGSEETEQAREKLDDSPLPQRGRGAGGEGNISPLPQRERGAGGEGIPGPSKELIARARELRREATTAEQLLWYLLRNRQLHGRKFRRQHPIGHFIADFFCDDARLVIEIDGAVHQEASQQERDRHRDEVLSQHNLSVLRFTNEDVFDHPEEVLQQISEFVLTHSYEKALPSRPSPTLRERGGSEETEQAREKLNDSPLPQRGRGAGGEGNISPLPQRGRGVGGEGFTVLYIGTLAPWQGVDFLLDALKLVVAQKPLRLQILGVGRREWRKALEKRVRKLGLMEYVEFLSPVPHEQVPAVIHAATICVAPLAPTERNVVQGCCPVKIFEYMACGKPIVAANLPVVREILTHEEDALLYKVHKPSRLAACLLRLAEDGELQQRLGENAWRKAQEQFSWQRAQTALRQVYATMLS